MKPQKILISVRNVEKNYKKERGEKIKIAACKVPAFKAGKDFKDLVK